MKRKIWLLAAALAGTAAHGAQDDWDSYLARELSPSRLAYKGQAATANLAPQPSRELTMLLLQARRHWAELSPTTQTLAGRWLTRPDEGSGDKLGGAVIYINPACEAIQRTTHFTVHYVDPAKSGCDSDASAAEPAFVTAVVGYAEDVFAYEHTTLGYAKVKPDGARGGDSRYDIYLANIGGYGIYGYTAWESSTGQTSPSYIVIDNDYAAAQFPGYADPLDAAKVTLAHEYFHAIQAGAYDMNEDTAWMENSATWVESVIYPNTPAVGNNDNFQYLGDVYTDANGNDQFDAGDTLVVDRNGNGLRDEGSLDYPEAPLDAFGTPYGLIQYGRFLWPQYLSEKFNNALIKDIWQRCATTSGDTAFSAMDAALVARGSSLAAAYQEYATWNYDKDRYAAGAYYPRVWVDATATTTANFSSAETLSLGGNTQKHLSTVYMRVNSPSGSYRFSSTGSAALTMLVDGGSGVLTATDVTLVSGGATWTAPVGAVKAIAVISNTSPSSDCIRWVFASGTTPVTLSACGSGGGSDGGVDDGDGTFTGGASSGGAGAFDLLAISIAGWLCVRRRRR